MPGLTWSGGIFFCPLFSIAENGDTAVSALGSGSSGVQRFEIIAKNGAAVAVEGAPVPTLPGSVFGDLASGVMIASFVRNGWQRVHNTGDGSLALASVVPVDGRHALIAVEREPGAETSSAAVPNSTGGASAIGGSVWVFQGRHRDRAAGSSTSDFTRSYQIGFR